jgi:AcrR family transcriptional regulator
VIRQSAEARLDSLLRTACDVIAARGLANTRAADVAAAAGVSQALIFYHFDTKEKLLARAFAYAAEQDLTRLETVLSTAARPVERLRRLLKLYGPNPGGAKVWEMWIDGWAEAGRVPEVARVIRRLDQRWKGAIREVIEAGVAAGVFECPEPEAAAWRITGLIDGLAVQFTMRDRTVSRRQLAEWIRVGAARELGLAPQQLA